MIIRQSSFAAWTFPRISLHFHPQISRRQFSLPFAQKTPHSRYFISSLPPRTRRKRCGHTEWESTKHKFRQRQRKQFTKSEQFFFRILRHRRTMCVCVCVSTFLPIGFACSEDALSPGGGSQSDSSESRNMKLLLKLMQSRRFVTTRKYGESERVRAGVGMKKRGRIFVMNFHSLVFAYKFISFFPLRAVTSSFACRLPSGRRRKETANKKWATPHSH